MIELTLPIQIAVGGLELFLLYLLVRGLFKIHEGNK